MSDKETGERKLQRIEFPAITSLPWRYTPFPKKLQHRGKAVTVLTSVRPPDEKGHYEGISAFAVSSYPDKIVLAERSYRLLVTPLWEKSPYKTDGQPACLPRVATFPPKWKGIAGVHFDEDNHVTIWNKAFPLLKYANEDNWKWAAEQSNKIDPLAISDVLLKDRGRAIAWLLSFASKENKDVWNALPERSPGFLRALWHLVFGLSRRSRVLTPVVLWIEDCSSSSLRVLSPNGWDVYTYRDRANTEEVLERYMPDPGEDWKLMSVEEEPERSNVNRGAKRGKRSKAKKKGGKR